jgi:putative Mg2+ transporter-C (MgtC) family protein
MFAIVTLEMTFDLEARGVSSDPTRVIQGLIGGLGFLGAGTIIQGERRVGGMATAASLWVAGAIGLAAGLGYALFAVVCALLAAGVLAVSGVMQHRGRIDRPNGTE